MHEIALPFTEYVSLGTPQELRISAKATVGFRARRIECNVPAPALFIIEDCDLLHRHDVFGITALPMKSLSVIPKNWNYTLNVTYSGFVPAGYICNQKFLFSYSLVGEQI